MMLSTSTLVPSASDQWVVSACQRSLGSPAQNRTYEHLGRLCGWGTIKPRRFSTLQIEETDGTTALRRRWRSCKVVLDGVGPGVEAVFGQGLAQRHDLVLDGLWYLVGRRLGPPGVGHEGGLTELPVPGQQLVEPGPGHPVGPCHFSDRAVLPVRPH